MMEGEPQAIAALPNEAQDGGKNGWVTKDLGSGWVEERKGLQTRVYKQGGWWKMWSFASFHSSNALFSAFAMNASFAVFSLNAVWCLFSLNRWFSTPHSRLPCPWAHTRELTWGAVRLSVDVIHVRPLWRGTSVSVLLPLIPSVPC